MYPEQRVPVMETRSKPGRWILAAAVAAGIGAFFRPEIKVALTTVANNVEEHNRVQTAFKDNDGRYVTDFRIFGQGGFMINGERMPEGSVLFLNGKPHMVYSHIIAQPTDKGRETFRGLISRCVDGYVEHKHFNLEQAYENLTELSGIKDVGSVRPGDYVVLPCELK
jgi:hypothetical protein